MKTILNMDKKRIILYFISGFLLVFLDQLTKFLFTGKKFLVFQFFEIKYLENFGSSFGIFSSFKFYPYLIILLSILILGVLIFKIKSFFGNEKLDWFFIFFFCGTFSNLIDRILFLYVRDFLYLKIPIFRTFIFNFADVFINISFILYLLYFFNNKSIKNKEV